LQGPAFLLFLDCTWQLLQQFPSAFEFTEIYLTALWDSVTLGVFRNFMHSTSHVQQRHKSPDHCKHGVSVWNWENQFDEATISLFSNPLYRSSRRGSIGSSSSWTFPAHSASASKRQHHSGTTGPPRVSVTGAIWPLRYHVPDLHVWTLCYLRWLSLVQIVDGGSATELLAQQALLSEIQDLQRDIAQLTDGGDRETPTTLLSERRVMPMPQQRVSSSYPFAAYQLSNQTATLSSYCMASAVRLSVASQDSVSVNEMNVSEFSNSEL